MEGAVLGGDVIFMVAARNGERKKQVVKRLVSNGGKTRGRGPYSPGRFIISNEFCGRPELVVAVEEHFRLGVLSFDATQALGGRAKEDEGQKSSRREGRTRVQKIKAGRTLSRSRRTAGSQRPETDMKRSRRRSAGTRREKRQQARAHTRPLLDRCRTQG